MKNGFLQKALPHAIAVIIFLLVAVIFCSPALSGKQISQSDVIHWKGMAQQSVEYKEQHGHFPLWTSSMFGGMPAYQIYMDSKVVITPGLFHYVFSLSLPKPINFFFLASLMFYFLCQAFRVNPWISILAALGYAYATYNPIIVAVGHDTKMLSMAYMPAVIGGIALIFGKKYWLGGACTALFSILLIAMNHLQIVYYTLITAGFMTLYYLYQWFRQKEYRHMAAALAIALGCGTLGVIANATSIFVTYDYSKATMRNGTLGLDTTAASGTKKSGLTTEYAFTYGSYGQAETMTLLVPGLYGGGGSGELGSNSKVAANLAAKGVPEDQAAQFAASLPSYWGNQPGHAGPVYLGAIMCFLFVFGMVYLKTGHRWWMLAAVIFSILLSWGKNLEGFNSFVFNTLPLYNKFRAPAMILVIPQMLFPLLGAMGLQRLFFRDDKLEEKWKSLKLAGFITGGLLAVVALMYLTFDFKGPNDENLIQYFGQALGNPSAGSEVYGALKDDRRSLLSGDLLRSIILVALSFGVLLMYLRSKLKFSTAIVALIVLNLFDLIGIGKRYLNSDNFVDPDQYDQVFAPTPADLQIKQDTGYYRVLNLTQDVFNDALTSYHHNSVGGYHPAKLSIVEDVLSFHLRKQPMNVAVLNMMNTKYVITPGQNNQPQVQVNPAALGHAWFVKNLQYENGWLAVMRAMDNFNPAQVAVLESADKQKGFTPQTDSAAMVRLTRYDNDKMEYQSNAAAPGFAVFSEIFYDRGWIAFIDGKEVPIARTNYALRGLQIPAGQHQIVFEFRPRSYYLGETIAFTGNIITLLLIIVALWFSFRPQRPELKKA